MTTLPPPLRGTSLKEGGKKEHRFLYWLPPFVGRGYDLAVSLAVSDRLVTAKNDRSLFDTEAAMP